MRIWDILLTKSVTIKQKRIKIKCFGNDLNSLFLEEFLDIFKVFIAYGTNHTLLPDYVGTGDDQPKI